MAWIGSELLSSVAIGRNQHTAVRKTMIKGTGICLSLWIMGCMLHVPVNSAGNDVKADDRVVFTVQTVEKRGESVSLVGRISRRPGSAAMFWGGRTFLTVCCYDGDGKRLSTDDQIWAMFSIDDFNERGVAEATFCLAHQLVPSDFLLSCPGLRTHSI